MDPQTLGVICGLIAMTSLGIGNAVSKKISHEVGPKEAVLFREIIQTVIIAVIVLIAVRDKIIFDPWMYALCGLLGIGAYAAIDSYYSGLSQGKVGVVSAIANSEPIVAIMLAVIFLGETITSLQIFAVVMIIGGVALLSLKFEDWKHSELFSKKSGIHYAFLTMILWGVVFFVYVYPVRALGPMLAVLLINLGMLISVIVHMKVSGDHFKMPTRKIWPYVAAIGILPTIGLLSYSYGLKLSTVSLVLTITSAKPLIVALFGRVAYKEKLSRQQWAAVCVIILGIMLMAH